MKRKDRDKKKNIAEPVLEFISGSTDTLAAKRLTKSICSLQSLWLLAKMVNNMKNIGEVEKSFD